MTLFRIFIAFVAAAFLAQTAAAQSTEQTGKTPQILLELNNASNIQNNGGCRLTYVVTNRSGQALDQVAYQVGVFDTEGIVRRILILEFGALTDGKTKILLFDLAGQSCTNISRIIVNDVTQCTLSKDESTAGFCLNGLVTSSRSNIQFDI